MAQSIREVMTKDPQTLSQDASVVEAAKLMDQHDIGNIIVVRDSQIWGILTDRDIVVRAIAEGRDPAKTKIGDISSEELTTLSPDETVDRAVELMREKAIRRLPVVEGETPVGIVSLGDLAEEKDPRSALADISKAAPNE
jgi:CBS domain-containing protein